MEPLSALAIATLVFVSTKVSETVVEKFTSAALNKANQLREKIWSKLKHKPEALQALEAAKENNSEENLEAVADYLKIAMREDPGFKKEIEEIAKEIEAGKKDKPSTFTQTTRDSSTGYQTQVNAQTSFVGGTHHHHP